MSIEVEDQIFFIQFIYERAYGVCIAQFGDKREKCFSIWKSKNVKMCKNDIFIWHVRQQKKCYCPSEV